MRSNRDGSQSCTLYTSPSERQLQCHANAPAPQCSCARSFSVHHSSSVAHAVSRPICTHARISYKSSTPVPMTTMRQALDCCLAREDLNNAIATCTDHQPPILTPADAAHAFASHGPVGHDVLRADAFLQAPETDRGVVAGGDGFAAVLREAEG